MILSQVQAAIAAMIRPMQRQVRLMVARAVVELVTESTKMQSLQLSRHADVVRDDVERFQQFGFTSKPLVGAEAIVVNVGSSPDHPVCIVVDDRRHRPTSLEDGECGLYTADNGFHVRCNADGTTDLGAGDDELSDDNLLAIAKSVKAEIQALRDTVNSNVTIFNAMTLPSGMGPVGPPPVSMQAPAAVGEVKAANVRAKQ